MLRFHVLSALVALAGLLLPSAWAQTDGRRTLLELRLNAPLRNSWPDLGQAEGTINLRDDRLHLGGHLEFPMRIRFDAQRGVVSLQVYARVEAELTDARGSARLKLLRRDLLGRETEVEDPTPGPVDFCASPVMRVTGRASPPSTADAGDPDRSRPRAMDMNPRPLALRPPPSVQGDPCPVDPSHIAAETRPIEEYRVIRLVCELMNSDEFRKHGYRLFRDALEDRGYQFFPGDWPMDRGR